MLGALCWSRSAALRAGPTPRIGRSVRLATAKIDPSVGRNVGRQPFRVRRAQELSSELCQEVNLRIIYLSGQVRCWLEAKRLERNEGVSLLRYNIDVICCAARNGALLNDSTPRERSRFPSGSN